MRFGRLVVCRKAEFPVRHLHTYWECICDCGNTTITRADYLTHGRTKSCGCLRSEVASMMAKQRNKRKKQG